MPAGGNDYVLPWFSEDFDASVKTRGQAMIEAANAIDAGPFEGFRADRNLVMARMFEGQPVSSLFLYAGRYFGGSGASYASFSSDDVSTWNVLRSVCMTAAAMVGRSKPRARFVTTGGKVKQRRRAKQATQFADGWAADVGLYETTFEVLVDCMRFDFGCIQLYEDGGRIKVQRVLPSEVRADALDALYGSPRTLYRHRFLAKDVLLAQFGKGKPAIRQSIETAPTTDPTGAGIGNGLVRVEEAWHLPSTPGGDDGFHVIAIEGNNQDGTTLFEEKWKKDYFPLLFLTWEKATTGMTGISLAMQLEQIQVRINKTLDRIDRAQRLMSVPRVAIKRGSKIVKSALSNQVAGVIEYTDTPPQALEWTAMQPEVYKWVEEQVQKAYDLPGISRNAAQGQKEAGTESAPAIREALDVQQTRLQVFTQKWETFHVELFRRAIDMIADVVADGDGYEVDFHGKDLLTKLDWKEIGLDEGEFKVAIYAVNQLPMTPQGRLDWVKDMMAAGLWDADRARIAFDDLDIGAASELEDAPFNLISKQYEDMLYDGVPHQPSAVAVGNVALATKLGLQYLALGELDEDETPAKNLDLVERYLTQLREDNAKINAPPPATPTPDVAGPAGAPGAPQLPAGPAAPLSPLPVAFAA